MDRNDADETRRAFLSAGVAIGAATLPATGGAAGAAATAPAPAPEPARPNVPPGRAGEFDFLSGNWRIKHRRRRPDKADWDQFEGEATCWSVLGGFGSIEELRIPARNFSGMGVRLLDAETRVWSDYWVNARNAVLSTPGQTGGFTDGVGTFGADDTDGDTPIKVRGVWDNISPTTCRWTQAISRDGGRTWTEDWIMDWTRA